MRILVADLDGTLLGGDVGARCRLHVALSRHPEVTVVFATGRGLPSVREALRDPLLPQPRWIIADVGASVIDGTDLTPLDALQSQLRAGWPGEHQVRAQLRRFPALIYQDGVAQDGRCSFYLRPDQLTQEITDAVQELGCTWLYSAGRYFDVLPAAAGKGSALNALARKCHWPMTSVLVAGDSLNDLSLFQFGAHGVIVGNAEPALLAQVPEGSTVHRPGEPGAAGVLSALHALGWVERHYPLVVGYHRPPVHWTATGWQQPSSPNGILPTLHSLFTGDLDAVWATAAVVDGDSGMTRLDGHGMSLPLAFLPLTHAEWAGYFHYACKETLWPVLMSQLQRLRFDPATWAHYQVVNARFADHISAHAAPGATVWLHDYNLWLVPGLLRSARPDLRLGLFHHTPFPSPDTFAALPTAGELRASLACLDWAGFHTTTFAEHFRQTLTNAPQTPRIGVHPLGIDRKAIEAIVRTRMPRRSAGNGLLVLSVERLDYAKAPVQKIEAIVSLLAQQPQLRGRLQFRLVCPPPESGIHAYDATRQTLERRIHEANKTWRTPNWQPIDYLPQALPFTEVIDHYLTADVFWVTSLQDGMNLTAKEFIAAQAATDLSGVLVLSRHAGAAAQLGPAALLTDPHYPEDLVETLHQALTLTLGQRKTRMAHLDALVGHDHPSDWARQIITAIHSPDEQIADAPHAR